MTISIIDKLSGIIEKIRSIWNTIQNPMTQDMQLAVMLLMGGLTVFGLLNVFLGFRLMRLWMMLGSLGIGLAAGYGVGWWLELETKLMLGIGLGIGVLLAVLSFFVYNWGVFVIGLAGGVLSSIYLLRPNSSLTFFLCLMLGVVLGLLGMKFSRIILIVATSLMGGPLAGYALASFGKLGSVPGPMGIPYGVLMGIGFSLLGIVVQLAMNPSDDDDDEEDDEEYILENEAAYENGQESQENWAEEKDSRAKGKKGVVHRDEFGRKYVE